jgi:hypothetical protein
MNSINYFIEALPIHVNNTGLAEKLSIGRSDKFNGLFITILGDDIPMTDDGWGGCHGEFALYVFWKVSTPVFVRASPPRRPVLWRMKLNSSIDE